MGQLFAALIFSAWRGAPMEASRRRLSHDLTPDFFFNSLKCICGGFREGAWETDSKKRNKKPVDKTFCYLH